jgi:hypothetical protein
VNGFSQQYILMILMALKISVVTEILTSDI